MQVQRYVHANLDLGRKITIPSSWHISKIGEVIKDIQIGFASGERDEDGITQLRMNNLDDEGHFDLSKLLKVPIPIDVHKYDIKKEDILFNNTNSLDLIGKTVISNKNLDVTFSNHISRIRTKSDVILPYYLYLLFLSLKKQNVFRSICNTHVGQSGIGRNELLRLLIYYPPLKEQQKIASILSNVDNLIQKTGELIEQTQRLKKGLMQRLLTKGIEHTKFKKTEFGEIPEEWSIDKLDNISKVLGGYAFKSKDYLEKGVRLLRITDVSFGYIYSDDVIYLPDRYLVEYAPFTLQEDDIVIVLTRPITSGGIKIARIKKQHLPLLLNQRVGKFIVKDGKKLSKDFLYYIVFSSRFIEFIQQKISTTHQPNISPNEIEKYQIFLPPFLEQQKIASILSNVDNLIQKLKDKKKNEETLKKGLMQQLLTGNTRVRV